MRPVARRPAAMKVITGVRARACTNGAWCRKRKESRGKSAKTSIAKAMKAKTCSGS
eukprot:CAMPEP_0171160442 /NCGR_PEP_ID=MMETSP0790-20130122/3557_1 /TAXON_ID=2925 /ORGANISM="Alexandrium catenella, Strain OF101" /LENGTH=55 /DNA_ID=CAMNT_0011624971 /DNA_START=203 /DNA_END=367 /DNA_ORIENTATION=-